MTLALNILKSFHQKVMANDNYMSNLLITRTGINSQMTFKFGYIVHFTLEVICP